MARKCVSFSVAVLAVVCCATTRAELVTFNLQAGSSLTLSGTTTVAGFGTFPLVEQGTGSLVTDYLGTITLDVNNALAPSSLVFQSAVLDASINGAWLPGAPYSGAGSPGPASAADYGITVAAITANGRVRDLILNLSAPSVAVSAGSFGVAGQTFTITSGNLDVYSALVGDGDSISLTNTANSTVSGMNTSALPGSYAVAGNIATLTIPVTFSTNYTIPGTPTVSGTNVLTGQLVAVATVPEPASAGLLALVGSLFYVRRRHRKALTWSNSLFEGLVV